MNLHKRNWLIGIVTGYSLLIAACSSKTSDTGDNSSGNGGSGASGANSNTGGNAATTGGKAPTGGKAATGGNVSTTPASTGGANTLANLPKPCKGIVNSGSSAGGSDAAAACVGVGKELEPSPLDMFMMMDRTESMTYTINDANGNPLTDANGKPLTRWDILQQGVQQFLTDPTLILKKPRIGLGFFGATGNPDDQTECVAGTYATPLIPIEDISTVTSKIISAVQTEQQYLGGQTPWQPSLQGALQYAQSWQQANPSRATVVVFVTDGYPTECDTDMNDITETVGEYFAGVQGVYNTVGKPGIRTYIIGVGGEVGTNHYNLDSVALSGGSGAATIANDAQGISDFAQAMANISNSKIDCDFPLPTPPDGSMINPDKVQVLFLPFIGPQQEIPETSSSGCATANGGWYFDDAANPTKVSLCPCSCANLGAGSISVLFGCTPARILN